MKRYSVELQVGVFVLLGILCIGYMAVRFGKVRILGDGQYTLVARFTSVSGLTAGASVEIAGVPVGQVDTVTLDPEEMMAVVRLKVKKEVRLADDVIASVKTAGLIGDKYIKLSPGGSPDYLGDGDTITETESAVDLEELISKYVFGGV